MSLDLIRSTGQGASAIGTRGSLSSNKRGGVIPHDEGRIYRDGMEGDRIHSHGDGVGAGDIGNVRRTEEQQAEAEAGKSPVAGAVDGDSKGRGEIRPIVSRGRSEKERQEKIATIKKQAKLKRPWGLTVSISSNHSARLVNRSDANCSGVHHLGTSLRVSATGHLVITSCPSLIDWGIGRC